MNPLLTSPSNPKFKYLKKLSENNRFRRKENRVLVEGEKEIAMALKSGWIPAELYKVPEIAGNSDDWDVSCPVYTLSAELYAQLAYRDSTEGVIAVFEARNLTLKSFPSNSGLPERILVLEKIEKPGNLGAILRSAEAFGVDTVFLADSLTDIYNPNVVRNSLGCILAVKTVSDTAENIVEWLRNNNYEIYTTYLEGDNAKNSVDLQKTHFGSRSAIVVGNEHSGVSPVWAKAGQNVRIRTSGVIDSLNLSNAAAILLYEWTRKA